MPLPQTSLTSPQAARFLQPRLYQMNNRLIHAIPFSVSEVESVTDARV